MDVLQRLVARRVEKLLEHMASLVARSRSGEELPTFTLTLHLNSGQQIQGEMLDYLPREAVLLATGREGLARAESVTYVDLASVLAVTVSHAERLTQFPTLVRPALGREDLLRHGERLIRSLLEQLWPGEEQLGGQLLRLEVEWKGLDDDNGRRALEAAMNITVHALRLIGRERNGRDTLRRFTRILFVHGPQTAASFEGDAGKVTVHPTSATPAPHVLRKGFSSGL